MKAWVAVVVALLLGSAASAGAQVQPSPRLLAKAAYERGDIETCARIYERGLGTSILSVPMIELDAAKCFAAAGRMDDALASIDRAIAHPAFGVDQAEALLIGPPFAFLRMRDDWPARRTRVATAATTGEFTGASLDVPYARRHPVKGSRFAGGVIRERRVTVIVWVAADGSPVDVEIEFSSGSDRLDNIAVETAWRWKYFPAVSNGRNYRFAVRLPFTF